MNWAIAAYRQPTIVVVNVAESLSPEQGACRSAKISVQATIIRILMGFCLERGVIGGLLTLIYLR